MEYEEQLFECRLSSPLSELWKHFDDVLHVIVSR
jgi:hypothetical protein